MSNSNKSKLGVWLMLIFIFIIALLNALGDIYVLIWGLTHTTANITGGIFLNAYFFGVYASRSLLLVFTPLTLVCSVLCLVFIGTRKLNLFKFFFFAACLIGLTGLIVNLIAMSPVTFFDVFVNACNGTFIGNMIAPMAGLLRTLYLPVIIIGVLGAIGVLVACMFYFKRSKRIAVWFNSETIQ
jgi:hypothetical protein